MFSASNTRPSTVKNFWRYLGRDRMAQKQTFLTDWKNDFDNVLLEHNNRACGGHVGVFGLKID